MDLDTLEVLPDTLQGWKHRSVDWLHDNSGFYYTAKPLEGEVPEGEHEYWHRGWFHRLGTEATEDLLVAHDDIVPLWLGQALEVLPRSARRGRAGGRAVPRRGALYY